MNQYRAVSAASPVVPIAPSPLVVPAPAPTATTATVAAGQKRKLNTSTSMHSTTVGVGAATTDSIPRRESAPATLVQQTAAAAPVTLKPSEYWKSALDEWSIPILDTVGIEQDDRNETSDKDISFLETTADRVEAYQNIELLTAVRRRDLKTLRAIAAEKRSTGSTMNACNRFGESILHLACRKGSLDVVQLLADECGCSLLLRDDYGRTILHDACWTVNPPWPLLKLILKKAPVLWRVSDVRGHLALQYVPKSAWPQWSAFLSKNRDLLQRIMVHSYHRIDIAKQNGPQQMVRAAGDSSTNDAAAVPRQTLPQHQQHQQLPQHQQHQQQHQPMPSRMPTSHPVSQHTTAGQQPPPIHPAQTYVPRPPVAVKQESANAVLAKALAQANPAMVRAMQQEYQPGQQGLSRYTPQAPAATTPQTGPATAALDEALRAQSAMRSNARSNLLMTEQQDEVSPPSSELLPQQQERPANDAIAGGAATQATLPYSPSIKMTNERLAGYEKSAPNMTVQTTSAAVYKPSNEEHPSEDSSNPLPAVPNPLLATVEPLPASQEQPQVFSPNQQQQQTGVPTSITTNNKLPDDPLVPNPIAGSSASSEDLSAGNSSNKNTIHNNNNGEIANSNHGNSVSSMTMSASQSVPEGSVSGTTTPTDTDSDRIAPSSSTASPSSNNNGSSNNAEPTAMDVLSSADQEVPQEEAGNSGAGSDKFPQDGSKQRVVG